MGLCMSKEQKAIEAKHQALQRSAEADKALKQRTVKLLLLGAGESGKSTLVKQMKIIHGHGYTNEELQSYRPTVCDNLVSSMMAVMKAMLKLRINLADQKNRTYVMAVLQAKQGGPLPATGLSDSLATAIRALWNDGGVQSCFARRNEYQLNDSARYYFEEINRIASPDYQPTEQDVLRARVRTTGVIETSFSYKDLIFQIIDVGGQRSERRKWMPHFEDVTALIFVSALSGYDLTLEEDEDTNRVHESMSLFEGICNNRFFGETSMILFMNKTDLFKEKLSKSPLKRYFPDYTGPADDVVGAQNFICDKFLALNKNPRKQIYKHFTCATDTGNIDMVFKSVSDIVEEKFLDALGLGMN